MKNGDKDEVGGKKNVSAKTVGEQMLNNATT